MDEAKYILLVEDAAIQAKKLKYVLEKLGYHVTWCINGKEAFDKLKQEDVDYSLIISDYQMPVMDGLQFLEAIKKDIRFDKIPSIFVSSLEEESDDEGLLLKSLELGANEFIRKPIHLEELKIRCKNLTLLRTYQVMMESENKSLAAELAAKNTILKKNFTELKDTHEQLKQMQTQLIENSKKTTLSFLGAGMAHELNNPLTVIKSYNSKLSKLALLRPEDKSQIKKITQSISKATFRITEIVKHLKIFTEGVGESNQNFEFVNPSTIINGLDDFLGGIMKRHKINVVKEFSVDNIVIITSINLLEQSIINLISNAIDAMESTDDKTLTFRTYKVDDTAFIEIGDTGAGIDPSILEHIFDPFFTTKAPNKGIGLGMSLIERYLNECNAEIECTSSPGNTIFYIKFKIADEKTIPQNGNISSKLDDEVNKSNQSGKSNDLKITA